MCYDFHFTNGKTGFKRLNDLSNIVQPIAEDLFQPKLTIIKVHFS